MSDQVSAYAGPYFRFKVDKVEAMERRQSPCDCKNPYRSFGSSHIYCPHCGKKLEWVAETVFVPDIKYGEIQHYFGQRGLGMDSLANLSEDKFDLILIPNLYDKKVSEYWSGYSSLPGIMMTEPDIEDEKAELANLYSRHFQALKELRGPERVTIEWGVVVTES